MLKIQNLIIFQYVISDRYPTKNRFIAVKKNHYQLFLSIVSIFNNCNSNVKSWRFIFCVYRIALSNRSILTFSTAFLTWFRLIKEMHRSHNSWSLQELIFNKYLSISFWMFIYDKNRSRSAFLLVSKPFSLILTRSPFTVFVM